MALQTNTSLEMYVKTAMCFSKTIPFCQISSVTDFPQLSVKQLHRRITLGSFKLKLSQSYIEQIIQHGLIYSLEKKQIDQYVTSLKIREELNYSKIVAVLIPSRHKRSKLYNTDDQADVNPKILRHITEHSFNIFQFQTILIRTWHHTKISKVFNFKILLNS